MLVAAKCTQCGANIQVDASHEAGVCPHCGTAFITEKAVNNYNFTNVTTNTFQSVTNISGGEVHIHEDSENADALFANIKGLLQMKVYPSNYSGDPKKLALAKDIELFQRKYPLDSRNYEINLMLKLFDIEGRNREWQASVKDLDELKRVDPVRGEEYHKIILDLVNRKLSENTGICFTGDMLDLKLALEDFSFIRSKYNDVILKMGQEGMSVLKKLSYGYDGEYVFYLLHLIAQNPAQHYLVKEMLSQLFDALKAVISPEDKLRREEFEDLEKEKFISEKWEKVLHWWELYVNLNGVGDKRNALKRLIENDVRYAEYLLQNNFKKTFLGVKYVANVKDDDAEELALLSLTRMYEEQKK